LVKFGSEAASKFQAVAESTKAAGATAVAVAALPA